MTRLVTAVLARNEAAPDRYLRRVLTRCREFSDDILLLDDNSTDATKQVASEFGCVVRTRQDAPAWGAEAPARRLLWELAAELAGDGWILVADADMILMGNPRPLTLAWDVATWAWPLADLWDSETTFRVDGPWGVGPATPRPWLFRPSAAPTGFQPVWGERGIHVGHCPSNWADAGPCFVAPSDIYWRHLAYKDTDQRARKHAQYMSVAGQLSEFEQAHAASILDV